VPSADETWKPAFGRSEGCLSDAVADPISDITVSNDTAVRDLVLDFRAPGMCNRVLGLRNSVFLNFGVLFAFTLILNRESIFVPSVTEEYYLLHLAKLWNSSVLYNDWTFASLPSHFVFNFVFGPLTLLFPLNVVGWLGRFLSSSLILVALLQLGRHFRIPLWATTVSILFWLIYRQSIVAGEWVLATFEAKSIAYVFLLFSLNGFLRGEGIVIPSILLGLAFSFHPLIGLWSALAVGLSLIFLRYPARTLVKIGTYTTLFALPGLIPLLLMPGVGGLDTREALKFVTLVVMPYHFDPFFFGIPQGLLLLAAMACFNVLHVVLDAEARTLRLLIVFQVFLGLFFIAGFVGRYLENYQLLLLMPCRLFPVLLPLFFFLHLLCAIYRAHTIRYGSALVVVGLVAFACCDSLAYELGYSVKRSYSAWTQQEEGVQKAFKWIATNTPADAIIVSPPWRTDSFYLSRRGQIASWSVPRFDRLPEWRARLESLVGDMSSVRGYGTRESRTEFMASRYNALTARDIESLVRNYGAAYLVSSGTYSYPVLFNSGDYRVYSLSRNGGLRVDGAGAGRHQAEEDKP
jgi:hypothetical protein